jgi:hypothetical protein
MGLLEEQLLIAAKTPHARTTANCRLIIGPSTLPRTAASFKRF